MNNILSLPRVSGFASTAETIGSTPVIPTGIRENIYQKLEYTNPSGSHYDRVYLPTILQLESEGLIHPGDQLRDITSGSAGISLGMIGSSLDYRVRITVPNELPDARVAPMLANGVEVIRSGPGYIKSASQFQRTEILSLLADGWLRFRSPDSGMRAVILEKDGQRVCYVNHSENDISPRSFGVIGQELLEQFQTETPAAIVLAMGNWTTISGIATVINPEWPDTKIIGYEGDNRQIHDNYGTSVDGVPLRFRNDALLDDTYIVTNDERDAMDLRFNKIRPLVQQVGHSSLMGLVVAEMVSEANAKKGPVVCIAYDQKVRY